jgi:hypothetical protein
MNLKNPALWARIQAFEIDDVKADFPFSKKLAKAQGWSDEFTQRAISEYRRFVYLCCTEPNGASPSDIVDEVWHLHLTYTQNYWEDFCEKVLLQPLHHHPSKGGTTEHAKHNDWYAETIDAYQQSFGSAPPTDIWQYAKSIICEIRPERSLKNWGPHSQFFVFLYLILLLVLPFVLGESHLFGINGRTFLGIYILQIIVIGLPIWLFVLPQYYTAILAEHLKTRPVNIDNYDVAFFEKGAEGVVQLAVVDAIGSGNLKYNETEKTFTAQQGDFCRLSSRYKFKKNEVFSTQTIYLTTQKLLGEVAQKWQTLLSEISLEPLYPLFAVLCIQWILGWARVIQGLENDKPVSFLVVLQIIWVFGSYLAYHRISSMNSLRKTFWIYTQENKNAVQPVLTSQEARVFEYGGADYLGSMGFTEMAVLMAVVPAFLPSNEQTSDGGGGCSGGGGCGGGGCGGGCGGCGG